MQWLLFCCFFKFWYVQFFTSSSFMNLLYLSPYFQKSIFWLEIWIFLYFFTQSWSVHVGLIQYLDAWLTHIWLWFFKLVSTSTFLLRLVLIWCAFVICFYSRNEGFSTLFPDSSFLFLNSYTLKFCLPILLKTQKHDKLHKSFLWKTTQPIHYGINAAHYLSTIVGLGNNEAIRCSQLKRVRKPVPEKQFVTKECHLIFPQPVTGRTILVEAKTTNKLVGTRWHADACPLGPYRVR